MWQWLKFRYGLYWTKESIRTFICWTIIYTILIISIIVLAIREYHNLEYIESVQADLHTNIITTAKYKKQVDKYEAVMIGCLQYNAIKINRVSKQCIIKDYNG